MRAAAIVLVPGLLLAACKPDPAPARVESTIANTTTAPPRRAKLPAMTRTNALVVSVQLRAEMAWTDAEAAGTAEAWDLAADLFARSLDACTADCAEVGYAAVLGRKNAMAADATIVTPHDQTTPLPLPARVEAFIAAADAYVASSPDDAEAPGVAFLASQHYNRYGWLDEATTRFAAIIAAHPTAEVAEYSANLLLDAFNRAGRYEELLRWARDLQANAALMAAYPEVAELVANLLAQAARAN